LSSKANPTQAAVLIDGFIGSTSLGIDSLASFGSEISNSDVQELLNMAGVSSLADTMLAAVGDGNAMAASLLPSVGELASGANSSARDLASDTNTSAREQASDANEGIRSGNEKGRDLAQKGYDKVKDLHETRGDQNFYEYEKDPQNMSFDPGVGERPEIDHDHGFLEGANGELDLSLMEEPTAQDYALLAACITVVETAELLRPDLVDGTSAVRHYLFGGGSDYPIDLDRFFAADQGGAIIEQSVIEDAQTGAMSVHSEHRMRDPENLDNGDCHLDFHAWQPVVVGGDARYPYPATENWQKAIGGFSMWGGGSFDVTVNETADERHFNVSLTIEMEDMYNFNPGQGDIASGVPDEVFGRLQVVGLGHEFLSVGSTERQLSFTVPLNLLPDECHPDDSVEGGEGSHGRPRNARPYPHAR
jgi:hypothetical protein